MIPVQLVFVAFAASGAILFAHGLLARVGVVPEPGTWHRVAIAAVSGVLLGISTTILVVAVVFLSLLLGGLALLALHYRGDGRWPELGALFVTFGGTWVVLWGLIVIPAFLSDAALPSGFIAPAIFGVGVAILTLGIVTLVRRPGRPTGD